MLADKLALICGESNQQVQEKERNEPGQDGPNKKAAPFHRKKPGKPKDVPGAGQKIQNRNLGAFGNT